ncbi:hypothetical protein JNN96_30540 [Mycobacterium sp. DSM 3803]|nr:hypothetical protein [Mycobacterium sp. DSM 3803]
MADGFWVVSVNRDTGEASTSDLIADKDTAWEEAARRERPDIFTTVVPRRHGARPRHEQS